MKILIIISVLLSGCSMEGGAIAENSKNKIVQCTDTRDGEVFSFLSNNVSNARISLDGNHGFSVVDTDGNYRELNKSMESYLKCKDSNIKLAKSE